MDANALKIRRNFYNERQQVLWEVDVIPPDSTCFRFLLFTDKYKEIVGVGHEEMAGKTPHEALPKPTADAVCSKYAECIRRGVPIEYAENIEVVPGVPRWWKTRLEPRADDAGQIYRLLGTATEIVGIEADLREAIAHQILVPHYQPICRLADLAIVGYEALIRWPGSNYSPNVFLPVAKRSDLLSDITRLVLAHALQVLTWLPAHLWIAVNVSNYLSAELLKTVLQNHSPVDPNRLRFEITEDTEPTNDLIIQYAQITKRGHLFELDDYGTDRSNTVWLSLLPLTAIKMDAQFVRGAYADTNKQAVCRAAATLTQQFYPRLAVIAEGIKTEKDLAFVKELGFEFGQGWLFGKPGPIGCRARID